MPTRMPRHGVSEIYSSQNSPSAGVHIIDCETNPCSRTAYPHALLGVAQYCATLLYLRHHYSEHALASRSHLSSRSGCDTKQRSTDSLNSATKEVRSSLSCVLGLLGVHTHVRPRGEKIRPFLSINLGTIYSLTVDPAPPSTQARLPRKVHNCRLPICHSEFSI